eukprot:9500827-Pyramimonas_sp.AAC.1
MPLILPSSSSSFVFRLLLLLLLILLSLPAPRLRPHLSLPPSAPLGAALITAWYFLSFSVSRVPASSWAGQGGGGREAIAGGGKRRE